MNLGSKLSDFWGRFQGELFPALLEEGGPLLGTHRPLLLLVGLLATIVYSNGALSAPPPSSSPTDTKPVSEAD